LEKTHALTNSESIELIEQRVVEPAAALICRKPLMSLGRDVQHVPGDQDRSRLLRLIKAPEKVHDIRRSEVSDSHDGAAAFTVLPQNAW
jgi:hypothetical protein